MKQPANLFAEQATQLFRLCQCEMNKDKSTWERGGRKRQAIHEMKLSQKPAGASKHYLFTIYLSLVPMYPRTIIYSLHTFIYVGLPYFYVCLVVFLYSGIVGCSNIININDTFNGCGEGYTRIAATTVRGG